MDVNLLGEQIGEVLQRYKVRVEDVVCSSALFLLSVNGGSDVTQKVVKWFYQESGEPYFIFKTPLGTEEYFTVVFVEGVSPSVVAVSFGVIRYNNQCLDVWSFKSKYPDVCNNSEFKLIDEGVGYVVEIARIDQDKSTNVNDLSDAKHIESKYLQRTKNVLHYYPHQKASQHQDRHEFLAVCLENNAASASTTVQDENFDFFKSQDNLRKEEHSWALCSVDDSVMTRAYHEYKSSGKTLTRLVGSKMLVAITPARETNIWGCLLYDIAAQSLSSASIPRTRLVVPWVITHKGVEKLMLKMVV